MLGRNERASGTRRLRMSWGTRVASGVIAVLAVIITMAPFLEGTSPAIEIVIAEFLMLFSVLLLGRIDVSGEGVLSRNVLTERWYPWASVERFEPSMRVAVLHADGGRTSCWAVQRANIAAMTGRVSRVDRVVAELEGLRAEAGLAPDGAVHPVTRIVRLTFGEWVRVLGLVPGIAALCWWMSSVAV